MATGATFPGDGEIDFQVLKAITGNFKKEFEIGTAGVLGNVYKGTVGRREVAVKRHFPNTIGRRSKREYCDQVRIIMQHEHENVVKLLGFCHYTGMIRNRIDRNTVNEEEGVQTFLCYDYFPNGNLHSHLFGSKQDPSIDWNTRFNIIKGICRGLHSLHTSLPQRIIHLNLKPQNILLDKNMVPKITDFVYSRIIGEAETGKSTKSKVGSVGYKAPEYLYKDKISKRTDIYALGLMMLEITTREENPRSKDKQDATEYIDEVEEHWDDKSRIQSIMSRYAELNSKGCMEVETCIKIGLKCVNVTEKDRPTIEEIVRDLNAL